MRWFLLSSWRTVVYFIQFRCAYCHLQECFQLYIAQSCLSFRSLSDHLICLQSNRILLWMHFIKYSYSKFWKIRGKKIENVSRERRFSEAKPNDRAYNSKEISRPKSDREYLWAFWVVSKIIGETLQWEDEFLCECLCKQDSGGHTWAI